jgi:DNA repair protein RecN (Recombination protein N)
LLSSVASGGEAARIVLALKAAPSSVWYSSPSGSPPAAAALVAIRAPLSEQQPAITVLDEIDSSIGSRLGLVIGRILRRMAGGGGGGNGQHHHHHQQQQQVICVSHLPQVAAHGQHHIVVRKGNGNGGGGGGGKERLVTKFKALDTEQERLDEVAAMLGLHGDAARELMAQVE